MSALNNRMVILAFLLSAVLPPRAQAEELDAAVTLSLVTPNGGEYVAFAVPPGNDLAAAYCLNLDDDLFYSALLAEGQTSVTVSVYGGRDYYCQVTGIDGYGSGSQTLTVDRDEHLTVQAVVLPFDTTAVIHLVEPDGGAVTGTSVPAYVYCGSSALDISFPPATVAPGDNSATVTLTGGYSYTCRVSSIPHYAAIYDATFFLGVDEDGKNVDLPLAPLDRHLIVHLAKADGSPYLASGLEWANCRGSQYSLFFSKAFPTGASSTDIEVLAGDYSCWGFAANQAVGTSTVTVNEGTAETTLPIFDKTAAIHLHLRDQAGNGVAGIADAAYSVWPSTAGISDWSWGSLSSGSAEVGIVPEVSYAALATGGCGTAAQTNAGTRYLFPCAALPVEAAAGEIKDLPIPIFQTDAAVNATVLDAQGNALAGTAVQAVETLQSAGSRGLLISLAFTNAHGAAEIPLVSNQTFSVSLLSTDFELGLPPAPVPVTLTPQENKAVALQYLAVDFWLRITAQIAGIDHGTYSCYAYDDAGHLSLSGANGFGTPLGQPLTLRLRSNTPWHIGCSGSNEAVYFSTDEVLYTPPAGQSSDDISISSSPALSAAAEPALSFHVDGQTFTSTFSITPAAANSLATANGISIDLPAGTLDTQSGSAVFTVATAAGLAANSVEQPMRNRAVTLSAYDGSNNALSTAQGKTYSIALSVEAAELQGIDAATLHGARYDAASGSYTPVPTTIDQPSGQASYRYILTAAQLGTYVLLKPRAAATDPSLEPPGKPTKLTLNLKGSRAIIRWHAPSSGGQVDSYELSMLRNRKVVLNRSFAEAARSFTWRPRQRRGRFVLRLAAVNAAGRSDSAHKAFRIEATGAGS